MQPGKCSFIFSASVAQEDHWHQCWGSYPEIQHVTSRKSSSLLWAELFFPSLLSMSPFSNNSPLIFLWRTTLPTCNPRDWVRLTPNPKSLGRLYVPVLGYMSHLPFLLSVSSLSTPQRICDGMCYHPSGDIRKRRVGTSCLSWTVETFTNLEAGGRIHCHFSALRFGKCLAWVMQLSKSFTGIFQNFKLSIKQTNKQS